MLTFSFFTAVFLTISWLMYIGSYLYTRLNGISPAALGLTDLAVYTALAAAPLFVIWGIWGSVYRFRREKNQQKQFKMIEAQFKQNQEFLEIVARLLYQGQQSRHSQFILSQTELFVNELNGLIADMLQRYNFISDSEAARLWTTAEKGNKWGFAKALINLQNSSVDFENRLYRTALRENLLRGAVNEFCARYARLLDILKQYDREKIFLNIIETGAFGKAFAILAPLADRLQETTPAAAPKENGKEDVSELFAEIDMRIGVPAQPKAEAKNDLPPVAEAEEDPLSELGTIEISDLAVTTEPVADSKEETQSTESSPIETLSEEEYDKVGDDVWIARSANVFLVTIWPEPCCYAKTPEEIIAAELPEAEPQTLSQETVPTEPQTTAIEEEISSMFAGAGIRGDDDDDDESAEKTSFFPNFGNIFKRRPSKEKNAAPQDEIDPLTLALERSFGKLSDSAPTSGSRLAKVMEAEENDQTPEKETSGRKFAFASTNETILKLQQELEQLKTPDRNGKEKDGIDQNAPKEDH